MAETVTSQATGSLAGVDYSVEDESNLARNLLAVASGIHQGLFRDRQPALGLLIEFHGLLFDGVRDHAGRIRRSGAGSPYLWFGPNKSLANDDVPNALLDCFKEFQIAVGSFEANPAAEDYESKALHLAVWVHAAVIRIHPFEDGNGRTCRLLTNWTLDRLGLRPIAFEVVRDEYLNCLNHFYRKGDIRPLVDLAIRLYAI